MYYFLSLLAGCFTAVMIVSNGKLSSISGLNSATLLIHIAGFLTISLLIFIKRENPFSKKNALILYSGGVIGVATTLMNNIVFGQIPISAIVALGLLGQSITSIVIDQFGFLAQPKNPLKKKQGIGLFFILLGIFSMMHGLKLLPVLFSMFVGFTLVISRIVNARLSDHTSTFISTFFNYFTGMITSFFVLLFLGKGEAFYQTLQVPRNPLYYLGGIISVAVVFLATLVVKKIPTLFSTLFIFVGQLFFGMVLDAFLMHSFSLKTFLGGCIVSIGLFFYLLFAKEPVNTSSKKCSSTSSYCTSFSDTSDS